MAERRAGLEKRYRGLPESAPPPKDPAGPSESAAWLAAPALAILAVVCCVGPLLVAALAATGASAWLAVHGYMLGAAALVALLAILAWAIRSRFVQ